MININDVEINGLTAICNVPAEHNILNSIYNDKFKKETNAIYISLSRTNKYDKGKPYLDDIMYHSMMDSNTFHKNLLIDLPEVYLTVEEQIQMANKLVQIIHRNINVIITVNSIQLIKHLNILYMINPDPDKDEETRKKLCKIFVPKKQLIPADKYNLYEYINTENKKIFVEKREVTKYDTGINAFDKIINMQKDIESKI